MSNTPFSHLLPKEILAIYGDNDDNDDMAIIECSGGYTCIVDEDDKDRLSQYRWQVQLDGRNGRPYASRSGGVWMHREVMGLAVGDPLEVDHRDNTATLDNRKQNLRLATRSENNCNRGMRRDNKSGIKGVSADRREGWWKAQIMKDKKAYNLGSYPTKEEAAEVYAEAARRLHGEFARIARAA